MRSQPKKRSKLDRLTVILLVAFVVVALITAGFAFKLIYNLIVSNNTFNLPGVAIDNPSNPGNLPLATVDTTIPLQSSGGPTAEPWDGVSRVNMLVMGLDYRDWESGDYARTDTMILFSIDPVSKTAGFMSIPRDMWVNIPGFDYAKINTAYYLGEAYKLPGGGPALAIQTVENFLGVPINYYAQVDFAAFEKFIDELGGVEVDVPEEIIVDPLGKHNTTTLQPGKQLLSGPIALAYARNRHTDGGDFDRAARQQQVILAIFDRITSLNMLPTLIARSGALYQELSDGVHTNLTLQQVIQLGTLALQIKKDNIRHGVIGPDSVYNATSPDGLAILIPIPDEIRLLRDEIFTTGGAVGPAAVTADAIELAKAENARISVQNGTYTSGLATKTAEYLRSLGLNVVEETNADDYYSTSRMFIYNGKPYTSQYISDMFQMLPAQVLTQYNPDATVDIVLILGSDWDNTNPMPSP
jgi:polyisoprenyl-teichoic acid--peptidoglycan teichoic acid transferase